MASHLSVPNRLEMLDGSLWCRVGALDSRLDPGASWGEHRYLFARFCGRQFGDEVVEEAAALLLCVPELRAIEVSGTRLTELGADRLRAMLPKVPVHFIPAAYG